MGDPKVSGSGFNAGGGTQLTSEDQMFDIVNNPQLDQAAKNSELNKMFDDLSGFEKNELYEKLKDGKNSKDPIARRIYDKLDPSTLDKTLQSLNPDHKLADTGAPPLFDDKKQAGPKDTQKTPQDTKLVEAMKRGALEKQLQADALPSINKAIKSNDPAATKVKNIRTHLENTNQADLKKIIAESDKWPEKDKKIFNEAIGHSEVLMGRVAKELTPDEQVKVINRSYETDNVGQDAKQKHEPAMAAWMKNVKPATLNHVIANSTYSTEYEITKQVQSGDVSNFNKLNSANKVSTATLILNEPQKSDLGLPKAMENMNATEKNMFIDNIQTRDADSQITFMQKSAKHLNYEFMEGIDKNNAEFMRKTYTYMAANAKTAGEKELYSKNVMYLENWMDQKFKR